MQATVRDGSSDVIRTPLGENNDIEEELKSVVAILDDSDITKGLRAMEETNIAKLGPRSRSKPWTERRDDTLEYFNHEPIDVTTIGEYNWLTGSQARLRPMSFQNSVNRLWNTTNSGLPALKRKGVVKEGYSEEQMLHELEQHYPAVLFTRTQENWSTRAVWGYPMCDTLREMMYYAPLLEVRKKMFCRAALLGPDAVDQAVTRMFDSMISKETLVSIDFSGFDKTVSSQLQAAAFDAIYQHFQGDPKDLWEIAERFNTIGLVTPDGVYEGPHGVPSGSTFTNEVDSLAQEYASLGGNDHDLYQIQGDDGLYIVKDSGRLLDTFKSHGLVVNTGKSHVSSLYAQYLQRYYEPHYRSGATIPGIYSVVRALNRLFYMERWTDIERIGIPGSDYFSIRAISILENCKHHPSFEKFVKFIYQLDAKSLGFSDSSLRPYIEAAKNRSGGLVNQYSDSVNGIYSFRTMQVLNTIG
jgi:hypothetical protein